MPRSGPPVRHWSDVPAASAELVGSSRRRQRCLDSRIASLSIATCWYSLSRSARSAFLLLAALASSARILADFACRSWRSVWAVSMASFISPSVAFVISVAATWNTGGKRLSGALASCALRRSSSNLAEVARALDWNRCVTVPGIPWRLARARRAGRAFPATNHVGLTCRHLYQREAWAASWSIPT